MSVKPSSSTDPCRGSAETWLALLSGASNRWLLTGIYAGFAGKLMMLAASMLISVAWGESSSDGFSGNFDGFSERSIILAVVFAPLFESAIVWISVRLLIMMDLRTAPTVLLAGLIHVPLHGFSAQSWSVLPVFMLHALICDNSITHGRSARGYWSIVVAHAVQNGLSFVLVAALLQVLPWADAPAP